jgi:membrane-bound lytic murein transglycosylase D
MDALRRIAIAALLAVLLTGRAFAQQPSEFDEFARNVEAWMRDNLDESVLHILNQVDRQQVRALFDELMASMRKEDVYQLAALKEAARNVLPILEQFEETQPYASWLKTHLDYFDVADQLKREGQPKPAPETQRTLWDKQFQKRPLPARAQKYVSRLKPLFVAQDAPAALVWVAEVESSFDPTARSPAGAVGMFQLMPATARSLSLALSPRDERLDPDKSAQAAAKYLRYLYGRFKDWRLALAAYNCGETRVQNLLARHKTRSYSAIASWLPAETQMYVPKIEATLRKREAISLASLRLPKG